MKCEANKEYIENLSLPHSSHLTKFRRPRESAEL